MVEGRPTSGSPPPAGRCALTRAVHDTRQDPTRGPRTPYRGRRRGPARPCPRGVRRLVRLRPRPEGHGRLRGDLQRPARHRPERAQPRQRPRDGVGRRRLRTGVPRRGRAAGRRPAGRPGQAQLRRLRVLPGAHAHHRAARVRRPPGPVGVPHLALERGRVPHRDPGPGAAVGPRLPQQGRLGRRGRHRRPQHLVPAVPRGARRRPHRRGLRRRMALAALADRPRGGRAGS